MSDAWSALSEGFRPNGRVAKGWLTGLGLNRAAPVEVLVSLFDAGRRPEPGPPRGRHAPHDRAGGQGAPRVGVKPPLPMGSWDQWPKSNQLTFTKSADWPLLKVR